LRLADVVDIHPDAADVAKPLFGGSARPMPRETWEIDGATEA
jgi:hypothetical protein